MKLRERINNFFDIADGKREIVKQEKGIGAGFQQFSTVLPPGDTFLHYLSLESDEDNPQYIRIRDPYIDNSWVYAAIQVMAQNMAQVPFKLYNGENEIEKPAGQYAWLWKLFNNVGPYMNRYALIESIPLWLSMRGECFWWLIRENVTGKIPSRIRILEPEYLRENVHNGEVVQWTYQAPDKSKILIDPKDIIQFKYYNPYNRFRGLSPLTATLLGLHIDYSAAALNYYFFNNNAAMGGFITTKSESITDQEKDAIELRIAKRHRGLSKTGLMGVLSHGSYFTPVTIAQKDMEYIPQRKWSRAEVFAVLSVNPALCGILEDASIKSNVREQKKALFENNLIPKMCLTEDVLRTEFFEREKLIGLSGKFDLDQVEALREGMAEKLKQAMILSKLGFTRNEINKRFELGFEDVPWGNVWWTLANMMPVGDDGTGALQRQQQPQQQASIKLLPEVSHEYVKMTQIWKAVIRLGEPVEKEMAAKLMDYFYDLRSEVLENILQRQGYKSVKAAAIEDDLIFDISAATELLRKNIFPYVEQAYELGIETLASGDIAYGLTNPRAMAALAKRAKDLEEINVTVAKQLKSEFKPILERGIEEGLSYDEIAGDLANSARNTFNNARGRAKTIARTEVNGAMSQARYDLMQEIDTPKHKWVSARDGNVRPSHYAIDGQIVAIGKRFSNGLEYPHDISGDPSETINCRCITVPVED